MSIPGAVNPLLLGGGDQEYKIERSLRFNSSDSAYLSRTPAIAGNRKTWTWAGWVKRSALGSFQYISGNADSSAQNGFMFRFDSGDVIRIADWTNTAVWQKITTQVFRDVSAWYHIVISYDTTNATAADRVRLYVNGLRITAFSTSTDPTQNYDGYINNTNPNSIGRWGAQADYYLNGYLADIHFIDGQALDPTSFAETNATTGQWVPKAYTGTYGTNGFRLAFADNSAATATTLGKDSSPNGNNWTPNNLSVTAGAGNDSLVDTPTSYGSDTGAGGEVRGNYATLNPLSTQSGVSIANGNLEAALPSPNTFAIGTIAVSSGKYYFEGVVSSGAGALEIAIGIAPNGATSANLNAVHYYSADGKVYSSNVAISSTGATWTISDVIGVAFEPGVDVKFYKNGVLQSTVTLPAGSNWCPEVYQTSSVSKTATLNFGQRQWAYQAPAGFKALCDTNLPAPVVAKPNTVFDVKLYTGNGSTQTISGLGFSPDLVWLKSRSAAGAHGLFDTVRGATKALFSNLTDAEGTLSGVSSFNSDGFSLGADWNINTTTFTAWSWDAGSSTVTNTQGSITSSVRANASAGFSIVTYTGTGANATVGHGLGVAPNLVIVKNRSAAGDWQVYHASLGNTQYISLNSTNAAATAAQAWNNTSPTSTVFSVGTAGSINGSGISTLAYCFAAVAGYSSFGSYTGNGSTDGPFVYTGFRPALVIVKMSSSTGNWTILDYRREGYNVDNDPLFPNLSNAEGTTDLVDLTSNGFKVRTTDATFNTNAGTYVYAAWAQNPFQYARAR